MVQAGWFSEWFSKRMTECGLTPSDMARDLSVYPSDIVRWAGGGTPNQIKLAEIIEYFGGNIVGCLPTADAPNGEAHSNKETVPPVRTYAVNLRGEVSRQMITITPDAMPSIETTDAFRKSDGRWNITQGDIYQLTIADHAMGERFPRGTEVLLRAPKANANIPSGTEVDLTLPDGTRTFRQLRWVMSKGRPTMAVARSLSPTGEDFYIPTKELRVNGIAIGWRYCPPKNPDQMKEE